MPTEFSFTNSAFSTLSYLNLASLRPGKTKEQLMYLYSSEACNNVYISVFPGLRNRTTQNSGSANNPVSYCRIMKKDTDDSIMKVDIAKETAYGELTANTSRGKVFFYNGSSYEDQTEAATITLPTTPSQKLYIGCDDVYRNIYFEHSTLGSYVGLYRKYSDSATAFATPGSGGASLPGDSADGTSDHSADGNLFLGTLTPSLWYKSKVNNVYMRWIEIGCNTVTTPGVIDVCYWNYVWKFTYPLLYQTPTYYVKSADATPVYTLNTSFVYEYNNKGEVVYDISPLAAGETLCADYSYKLPTIGTNTINFNSDTECTVNGGSAITIVCDGETDNTNIVDGINFRINDDAKINDIAIAEVTELAKYVWLALDSSGVAGTYGNTDLALGNVIAESYTPFWLKCMPIADAETTLNSQSISLLATGVDP